MNREAIRIADEADEAINKAVSVLLAEGFNLEDDDCAVPLEMAGEIIEYDTDLLNDLNAIDHDLYYATIDLIQDRIIHRFRAATK